MTKFSFGLWGVLLEQNFGVDNLLALVDPTNDEVAVKLIPNDHERRRYFKAIEKFQKTREDNTGQVNLRLILFSRHLIQGNEYPISERQFTKFLIRFS